MSFIGDKIKALTKQLYPTGRAFRMAVGGAFEKLHTALGLSEERAYLDAVAILNSILPDNADFTAYDAADWEARLGLITNLSTPLADRKLAIIRKMNHPGTIKARQHYLYMQGQLQAAGFNVYVYENRFLYLGSYITKTPSQFSIPTYPTSYLEHSSLVEHGDAQHGNIYSGKIVSYIYQSQDDPFDVGANLRSTFFIGGVYPGEWATVLASREQEFRQLILKLKPAQEVGFLLVTYI